MITPKIPQAALLFLVAYLFAASLILVYTRRSLVKLYSVAQLSCFGR
jgi:hypothetical protein